MEKKLEMIGEILHKLNYTPKYVEVLLKYISEKFESSSLEDITPSFIYSVLAHEEGKSKAQEIAEYYEEYLKTGQFKTRLEKMLNNSPWMK